VEAPTGDRVLLIGIDAATWTVLRPLLAEGRLPAFGRLVQEGWSGTLLSMDPTLSPALWTTIATGKTPAQHGISGFLARGADGQEIPVTSNLRRSEALWTIASRHGRRVNVVGWYVTWPTEAVNGVMVSDRFVPLELHWDGLVAGPDSLTREHPGVYPSGMAQELERFFVTPNRYLNPVEREFHRLFKAYPVDASRTAIAEHLMQTRPADLTMVYLWGVDPIQHHFWKFYQPETWGGPPPGVGDVALNRTRIPDYYREVDGFLGRLLARVGPRDTVLIVSDHGAGPVTRYDPAQEISGDHRLEGVIIAAGHHVRHGEAAAPPSIVDITPTVLYLLGLPIGADMAGQVIRDLVDPAFLSARPPRTIPTHEPKSPRATDAPVASPMDEAIKERLRSLGYIQ
jgi:predicted AlkP superfamily phosphohydrolase/phosphomutase